LVVTVLEPLLKGQHVLWAGPLGYRDAALYRNFWKIRRALPDRRDVRVDMDAHVNIRPRSCGSRGEASRITLLDLGQAAGVDRADRRCFVWWAPWGRSRVR
jgi:hypothetical protein